MTHSHDDLNITIEDPRLTAYALGETDHLSPEELTAIERFVAGDADAAEFVAALRGTGDALAAALGAEPAPLLTAAQRERVSGAPTGAVARPPGPGVVRPYGSRWVPVAVAASGLIAIGLLWQANMGVSLHAPGLRAPQTEIAARPVTAPPAGDGIVYLGGDRVAWGDTSVTDSRSRQLEELAAAQGRSGTAVLETQNFTTPGSESRAVRTAAGGTAADGDFRARTENVFDAPEAEATGGAFQGPHGEVPPDSRKPTDPAPAPTAGGPTTPGGGAGSVFGRGGNTPGSATYVYGVGGSAGGGHATGGQGTPGSGGAGSRTFPRGPSAGSGGGGGASSGFVGGNRVRTADPDAGNRGRGSTPIGIGGGQAGRFAYGQGADPADAYGDEGGGVAAVVDELQVAPADAVVLATALRRLQDQQGAIPRTAVGFYRIAVEGREVDLPGTTLGIDTANLADIEIARRVIRHIDQSRRAAGNEWYENTIDNQFLTPRHSPLSTFSVDVDTASYANVRRMLVAGQMPPQAAVRTEELINYFDYDYPQPHAAHPFSVSLEVAGCPWNVQNRLVRIGLQGRDVAAEERKPSNLVFLLDVSGSMGSDDKLPLLKQSMRLLVEQMREEDRVAIVVYASNARVVLESTSGANKAAIHAAINALSAGGSTNGGQGIQWAYEIAQKHLAPGGTNRVLLGTDGDFNVGVTSREDLVKMVADKAKGGVFLSILGFGTGNLKDAQLEKIADRGNGHYHYIDSLREGRRVLVEQVTGTLETIAKDVKLQVEFNPAQVQSYRLIGYANRLLAPQDFNDDTKDAGEIGAGHTVTALYEIVPVGGARTPGVDPLKYQEQPRQSAEGATSGELLTVKLRYKQPEDSESHLIEVPLTDGGATYGNASTDFKFAAGVAAFAMLLRDSPFRGNATYGGVLELAGEGVGDDPRGYRTEFLDLVRKAKSLSGGR